MTYSPDSGPKRLMRSGDRWIGGVCGGLADYFGLDPALVRLLFVASILLPGPQLLIYVILWFVMPDSRASRARA
ncbi:PspC domain-containing protein [Dietzia kunjamensis]|uniref:PspC domain-containing protein n=1 Tax=Dietzia kunjamensis TaxID=322509 RepID=UPI00388FE58F